MSAKLDKQMQANILNYGDEIKTISSFVDAVRKTVGQYLGYTGNKGHLNMVRELYQNALDEMLKEDSPCHEIWVTYDENTLWFSVRDTGRGIPFDNMVRIFATQHTSSNYKKKAREFSSGRHGVGSKVTNACSKKFIAESYLFTGDARKIEFNDGHPWKKGEIKIPNPNKYQGSKVSFVPAKEVMGEITTSCKDILELVSTLLMLTTPGIGNTVHFHGVTKKGEMIDKDIVNQDGIVSFLVCNTENPVIAPILISNICDTMKVDIAFTYDDDKSFSSEEIVSFANMCPTVNEKSTHVQGFLDALSSYFRNYMNKIYLHGAKTRCIGGDIKTGLRAVVTVSHLEPIFSGQAKEIFSNEDIIPYIATTLEDTLNEWSKFNSNDLQKLCKYFKEVADWRLSEDESKVNFIKRVKNTSVLTGLPAKYKKPEGRKHLELIIVEGDSAMSPATRGRDPLKQGLFPIRGKIINAFTSTREKVLKNEEVCGIAAILGAGIGKNFDINKCKFEKIIFMADADYDGYQIRELLMKLFLLYFRPLIEAGRVYIAVPPLYSIKEGKNIKYFVDRVDYTHYVQKTFSKKFAVGPSAKKLFSSNELVSILYKNSKYADLLDVAAMNYAVHPQLLEFLIRYRNKPTAWLKKFLRSKWRFLTVSNKNGTTVIDGLVGDENYTVICNDKLYSACKGLFSYVDNSLDVYFVNGQPTTLLELMTLFGKFRPKGIQRYKGLGEMSIKELKYSTLHPDGDRTLLRLTTNNIKKQIQEIKAVQSDISSLLKKADIAGFNI